MLSIYLKCIHTLELMLYDHCNECGVSFLKDGKRAVNLAFSTCLTIHNCMEVQLSATRPLPVLLFKGFYPSTQSTTHAVTRVHIICTYMAGWHAAVTHVRIICQKEKAYALVKDLDCGGRGLIDRLHFTRLPFCKNRRYFIHGMHLPPRYLLASQHTPYTPYMQIDLDREGTMNNAEMQWFIHTPHFPFNEVRKVSIHLPSFVCTTVKESAVDIYISVLVSLAQA